jgi:hypothetical protein
VSPADADIRLQFAKWVRGRLQDKGLTEAELGALIGRRRGWLDRFEHCTRTNRDLTLRDAMRVVVLLGGDPNVVFGDAASMGDGDGSPGSAR